MRNQCYLCKNLEISNIDEQDHVPRRSQEKFRLLCGFSLTQHIANDSLNYYNWTHFVSQLWTQNLKITITTLCFVVSIKSINVVVRCDWINEKALLMMLDYLDHRWTQMNKVRYLGGAEKFIGCFMDFSSLTYSSQIVQHS